jgi:hypothetical protein
MEHSGKTDSDNNGNSFCRGAMLPGSMRYPNTRLTGYAKRIQDRLTLSSKILRSLPLTMLIPVDFLMQSHWSSVSEQTVSGSAAEPS